MSISRFCTTLFLTTLVSHASAQESPIQAVPVALAQEEQNTISRQISLAELGYSSGVSFSRLAGQAEMFFPMPDASAFQSATLVLDFVNEATLENERYLHVIIDGRVVRAVDLTVQPRSGRLEIPIKSASVQNGFLHLKLEYSGGASKNYCVDERASGDFFEVAETSHVALNIDPSHLNSIQSIAALQPPQTRISIPDGTLASGTLSAALKAASHYNAEMGYVVFGGLSANAGQVWTEAHVSLNPTSTSSQFLSSLQTDGDTVWPTIEISGEDPQRAIEILGTQSMRGLASTSILHTNGMGVPAPDLSAISFEQLGFDLRPQNAAGTVRFDHSFDISQLPKGTRPSSVALLVAAAGSTDTSHGDLTVVAFLNDTFLGSGVLRDAQPEWFEFEIPKGLEARNNFLRVQVMRQAKGDKCIFAPIAYPAQILPVSRLVLEERAEPMTDFFQLRQLMRGDVDVLVDTRLASVSADDFLNAIAPTVAGILPKTAELKVTQSLDSAATTPFIFISDTPPAESDPRLRFDNGVVELRNASGDLMFSTNDFDRFSTAQIVTVGARVGLWLRPGSGSIPSPTSRQPLILDRGDVALIDNKGVVLSTSTTRNSLVQIEYPEQRDLAKILEQYRPWIVVGIWLLVSLIVIRILRSMLLRKEEI